MPFAGYEDFDACVAANQDKDDPSAYCAAVQRRAKSWLPVRKHGTHDQSTHAGDVDAPDLPDYIGDASSRGMDLTPEVMERHADVFNLSDSELRAEASATFDSGGDAEMAARHNVVQTEMWHRRQTGEGPPSDLSVQGDLVDKINRDGGFTVNPSDGTTPEDGFMVSIYENAEEVHGVEDVDVDLLRDYVERHRSKLEASSNHLGAWIDRETGEVYIDISMRTESRDTAVELGRAANQKAVFDLGSMEEIRLDKQARERAVVRVLAPGGVPSDETLERMVDAIKEAAA